MLLPAVAARLNAGGRYAFSHTHPADVAALPAKARVARYDLDGEQWQTLMLRYGFAQAHAWTVLAPTGNGQRTLLVSALRA